VEKEMEEEEEDDEDQSWSFSMIFFIFKNINTSFNIDHVIIPYSWSYDQWSILVFDRYIKYWRRSRNFF
jgi:hypothetical protein